MLRLSQINKSFFPGTINEKHALRDVELKLSDGDFVTVIGGNGAGKSTLLNVVAGVFPVDTGKVEIGSEDLTKKSEHMRAQYIGRVFQDPMMGTAADMTIEENLAMAARRGRKRTLRMGVNNAERMKFFAMLEELDLGLETRMKTKVGLLSGGQRQALTLLMATMTCPDVLLLDEHTAALDPKTARKVSELTDRIIQKNHLTTMMVTHNMKDALRFGNRIIMLHEGRIILDIHEQDKRNLTVEDLLHMFEKTSGGDAAISDRMLLG